MREHHATRFLKPLLLTLGVCATGLGIVGMFVPVLPTVPFLLLAAACFARSSERLHDWLVTHPRLGPLVRDYLDGRGIPEQTRRKAIFLLWASILLSIFLVAQLAVRLLLLTVAVGVTWYLLRLPTAAATDSEEKKQFRQGSADDKQA